MKRKKDDQSVAAAEQGAMTAADAAQGGNLGEQALNESHPPEEQQAEPKRGEAAEVLAALRFKVDGTLNVKLAGQDAVELYAVVDEVPRYLKALHSARNRIARKAKVPPQTLPLFIGIVAGEIVMSIATPYGKDSGLIVSQTKDLCAAIMQQWRSTSQAAKEVLGGKVDHADGIDSSPPEHARETAGQVHAGGEGDAGDTDEGSPGQLPTPVPPVQPFQVDPMTRHLLEALMARERPGSLSLNFTSAGQGDQQPPVVVPPAPTPPVAMITLGEPRVIEARVCHRTGAAACLLREPDVSKQRRAGFSTSDKLSTMINLLVGCPPVLLEVRDCVSDQPQVKPPHDYVIVRLVGVSPTWWAEPSVIDHLQGCMDELRALLVTSKAQAAG